MTDHADDRQRAPDSKSATTASSGRLGQPRRRVAALVAVAATAAAVLALAVLWTTQRPSPLAKLPEVDLAHLSEPISRSIMVARERVTSTPRSADAWGQLGMVLLAHEFESQAGTCFRVAAELDPAEFRWPYLMGIISSVQDPPQAIEHFRRAVELDEHVYVAHCRLAELLLDAQLLAEAEQQIQFALELDADQPRAWMASSRLARQQGRLEDSLVAAQNAVRAAPGERATHELLAMVLADRGEPDEARRQLQAANELPNRPLPWEDPYAGAVLQLREDANWSLEQAETLIRQNRVAEAIAVLQDAVDRDPQNVQAFCRLGRLLSQVDNLVGAAYVLDRAGELHPDSAEVQFQRGVVFFMSEQFADAAKRFQRAIQLKSDYALAHYNLGHCLLREGRKEEAAAEFQETIRFRPGFAAAHTNLARLLLDAETGDGQRRNEAIEHLRTAVQLEPQDTEARQLLNSLERKRGQE